MHVYSPEIHELVSDIEPEDFIEGGSFASLRRVLTSGSFDALVADEVLRVKRFLDVWQSQLLSLDSSAPIASTIGLAEAFIRTRQLSGVVYLSNNIVVSEALFDESGDGKEHPTSRTINNLVRTQLPWAQALTFSVPRIYEFFGYRNSWGFIRFPRRDDLGNGAGVLISTTTLDPRILRLLQVTGYGFLAKSYNRVWDGGIHDYAHHIVLYTSPSFGIGRVSPMSIARVNGPLDEWGADIMAQQRNNYEYWAHKTHRLINSELLTEVEFDGIIENACQYIQEVFAFYRAMSSTNATSVELQEGVVAYLLAVYLWPLNILLDPQSAQMQRIYTLIDSGPFRFKGRAVDEVVEILLNGTISESPERLAIFHTKLTSGLDGILYFISQAKLPIELGIVGYLRAIGVERWSAEVPCLSWGQRLRLIVSVVGYRGFYEAWRHDQPVLQRGSEVMPHQMTISYLGLLEQTLVAYQRARPASYELQGIVP